jgi:hypothetical protein
MNEAKCAGGPLGDARMAREEEEERGPARQKICLPLAGGVFSPTKQVVWSTETFMSYLLHEAYLME